MAYLWPQGNVHTQFPVQVIGNNGTPVDLTGVPFNTITLQKAVVLGTGPQTYPFASCAGSVTAFTDVANGKFTYKFASSDVSSQGNFQLVIVIDYGGGDFFRSLPLDFTVVKTT